MIQKEQFDAVLFDMDGVIIDSEPLHFDADQKTMAYLGHEVSYQELEKYVGMTNPDMWAQVKREYPIEQTVEEIIEYQLALKIEMLGKEDDEPIDGIRDLLAELQRSQKKIALASSSPRIFIEEVLKKFNIIHLFDSIVSGEEVPRGKPAPDVFLAAARELGVPPERCVVIEDSQNGVKAAKSAGMTCVGFINPNSGNMDLSLADVTVHSIRDIYNWIAG